MRQLCGRCPAQVVLASWPAKAQDSRHTGVLLAATGVLQAAQGQA